MANNDLDPKRTHISLSVLVAFMAGLIAIIIQTVVIVRVYYSERAEIEKRLARIEYVLCIEYTPRCDVAISYREP